MPPASQDLNADFGRRVAIATAEMAWQASPSPGVWRKRLDLSGPVEAGRVTSVVRYEAGAEFKTHGHPDGEEILVLEGAFADEHGAYPTGTYLLNPEGFFHAPRCPDGCVLLVKLRQYPGLERGHVVVETADGAWEPTGQPGVETIGLYHEPRYPEEIRLLKLAPGADLQAHEHHGGEEMFVLEGELDDEDGRYASGAWVRWPRGSRHHPRSRSGCLIYVKSGHLPS